MKYKFAIWAIPILGICMFLSGCSILGLPKTSGENQSGFTYVPIDPFSVEINTGDQTNGVTQSSISPLAQLSLPLAEVPKVADAPKATEAPKQTDKPKVSITPQAAQQSSQGQFCLTSSNILRLLPDNAVRIAVEQYDASGNVTYGPAGLSVKNGSYKITIDYINADTSNARFWILKSVETKNLVGPHWWDVEPKPERVYVNLTELPPDGYVPGSEAYTVKSAATGDVRGFLTNYVNINFVNASNAEAYVSTVNIPVYIGIGLRITADITTLSSDLKISGLGAIGAEADADHLSGTLVVQTLGINGKSIAAALPIESELNQTTTQNAIVAVGQIKSLLYEPDTIVVPRVVGIYLPFAGGKPLVNAIISELSRDHVPWTPCQFCN